MTDKQSIYISIYSENMSTLQLYSCIVYTLYWKNVDQREDLAYRIGFAPGWVSGHSAPP